MVKRWPALTCLSQPSSFLHLHSYDWQSIKKYKKYCLSHKKMYIEIITTLIHLFDNINKKTCFCPITERLYHLFFILAYRVPEEKKRRKTTVMEQVSTLVSATVAQLREMDAAMQAQEEARLQRLMDHEREMQNNLMTQLVAMHERISRENHERHLELVDRILSRFPSPSAPSGPWLTRPVWLTKAYVRKHFSLSPPAADLCLRPHSFSCKDR